jgi:hypothetical protein
MWSLTLRGWDINSENLCLVKHTAAMTMVKKVTNFTLSLQFAGDKTGEKEHRTAEAVKAIGAQDAVPSKKVQHKEAALVVFSDALEPM